MASEKILSAKKELVSTLKEQMASSVAGVLVNYHGISVLDDTKMRRELREAGVVYTVIKNSTVRFAVEGTAFEDLTKYCEGATAVAISKEDPIVAAKIIAKYVDITKEALEIKAGYMDGKVMNASEVNAIAKLPSKEGLLSMLCSALSGNIRGLAVALNAIAEKKGEAA
ncbi:MAG: 50S ribosomal protein L10 [Oscillospiraceae bacterium]